MGARSLRAIRGPVFQVGIRCASSAHVAALQPSPPPCSHRSHTAPPVALDDSSDAQQRRPRARAPCRLCALARVQLLPRRPGASPPLATYGVLSLTLRYIAHKRHPRPALARLADVHARREHPHLALEPRAQLAVDAPRRRSAPTPTYRGHTSTDEDGTIVQCTRARAQRRSRRSRTCSGTPRSTRARSRSRARSSRPRARRTSPRTRRTSSGAPLPLTLCLLYQMLTEQQRLGPERVRCERTRVAQAPARHLACVWQRHARLLLLFCWCAGR